MPKASPAQIKAKFRSADKSRDGQLDFNELRTLLQKGNPSMRDSEIRTLFRGADSNRNGYIDFNEFVDFVYNQESGGEQTDVGPPEIQAVFRAFCGSSQMTSRQFERLCEDCCLCNQDFKKSDTELVFMQVKAKKRDKVIGMTEFLQALHMIADKRGCNVVEIHKALEIQGAPQVEASSEPRSPQSIPRRASASEPVRLSEEDVKSKKLLDAYMAYASGRDGNMDSRMFEKLLVDSGLVNDRKFTALDVEMLFAATCKRADRRITFGQFRDSLRTIAEKKGCHVEQLERKIRDGYDRDM